MSSPDEDKLNGENDESEKAGNETEVEEGEIPPFVLPKCIVEILDDEDATCLESAEDEDNIPTDHQYFNALLATETCRALIASLGDQNRHKYFQLDTKSLSKRKTLAESLDDLFGTLKTKLGSIRKRMEEGDRAPLIEKFLDALEANEEEKKIFRHVLCLGMMPTDFFPRSNDLRRMTAAYRDTIYARPTSGLTASATELHETFGVPLPRIMRMMNADSVWVKEQVYFNNSESHTAETIVHILSSSFLGHAELVLQGYAVTLPQYDALKSSLLQKTLLEHPPFLRSDAGKRVLKRNAVGSKQPPEGAASGRVNPLANALKNANPLANATEDNNGSCGGGGPNGGDRFSRTKGKRDRLFDALAISMKAEKDQKLNNCKSGASTPVNLDNVGGTEIAEDGVVTELHPKKGDKSEKKSDEDEFSPYVSDLAYLEDQVRANILKKKIVSLKVELDTGDDDALDDADESHHVPAFLGMPPRPGERRKLDQNSRFQKEKKLEKTKGRLDQLRRKIAARISASAEENGKVFRLEQLCEALRLGDFEKSCILLLLQDVIIPGQPDSPRGYSPNPGALVGTLISSFCSSLEDKMKSRSFFYKTSTMVEEGLLTLFNDDFTSDLSMCSVRLDRRLFDFLVGLDTEMSELVNGSHLYKPEISVDDVVLPAKTKKRVLDAVLSFEKVKDVIHETGMDEKLSYGLGQVLLFYGASGTGKTMLANAIAAKLGVKILLINFPDFGMNKSGATIKFLFREARINKALLFFDECESLFMSRQKQGGKGSINMLLTELERFDGICILATNLAQDLDEAMHRRISLSIEFQKPDHIMREKLWKAIQPPKLPVNGNVNFGLLGRKYELVGGTIKNAWIQSISIMIHRGGDKVTMEDLEQSASEQVRNQLTCEEFDHRVVPENGIDAMILDDTVKESLNSIVQYSKAQSVLFGQWGFDKIHRSTSGISVLFHGVPGTGKTMAAEAIGFDLGRPLLVVNVAELVSKWVGETGKNISKIFATAKSKDAILVFDEAEGLFGSRKSSDSGSTSRHDTLNVGLLLQLIENFTGICVVITNMKASIDEAFFRRFRFVLEFKLPNAEEREKIWKITLPAQCPVAKDVDFRELARRHEMSGGGVKNALLRAATIAALREDGKNVLTMRDLRSACDAEEGKVGNKFASLSMYS